MAEINVDVDPDALAAAMEALGSDSAAETIGEALRLVARRADRRAAYDEMADLIDSGAVDLGVLAGEGDQSAGSSSHGDWWGTATRARVSPAALRREMRLLGDVSELSEPWLTSLHVSLPEVVEATQNDLRVVEAVLGQSLAKRASSGEGKSESAERFLGHLRALSRQSEIWEEIKSPSPDLVGTDKDGRFIFVVESKFYNPDLQENETESESGK